MLAMQIKYNFIYLILLYMYIGTFKISKTVRGRLQINGVPGVSNNVLHIHWPMNKNDEIREKLCIKTGEATFHLPLSHTSAKIRESTTMHFLAVLGLFTFIFSLVELQYYGCSMCSCVHEIQVFLFTFIIKRRTRNVHEYIKILWILDLFWLSEFCIAIN